MDEDFIGQELVAIHGQPELRAMIIIERAMEVNLPDLPILKR